MTPHKDCCDACQRTIKSLAHALTLCLNAVDMAKTITQSAPVLQVKQALAQMNTDGKQANDVPDWDFDSWDSV